MSFVRADARSCRLDAPSLAMHFPLGVVAVGGTLLWGGGPRAWRRVWGDPQLLAHLRLLCLVQEVGWVQTFTGSQSGDSS